MWAGLNSFFKDLKHAGKLGFAFLLRHPLALFGQTVASFPIRKVGRITLRYKETDAAVLRQVFSRREYNFSRFPQRARLQAAYEAIAASGKRPLIIDAGANIGLAAIWFAKLYPKALVVAIEPDAANLEICRRNVAPFENILLVEGAIGARSGRVGLVNPKGRADAVRTERDEAGAVQVFTIADLRARAGPDTHLLLVKVDIEGFESDLFSENVGWIDDAAAVIVEPHDWMLPGQFSSRPLQRAMFSRDFEMLIHRESLLFIR
jgi:FkbM family methyltransferase